MDLGFPVLDSWLDGRLLSDSQPLAVGASFGPMSIFCWGGHMVVIEMCGLGT